MKKILSFLFVMMMAFSSLAQRWTGPDPSDFITSTPVYVSVQVNGKHFAGSYPEYLELAAFIDGECRSDVTEPLPGNNSQLYQVRVWGSNADISAKKPITFKAYYKGIVYRFTKTIPMTGEEYTPIPLVLNLDLLSGLSLPEKIELNSKTYPYTADLSSYLTYQYKDQDGNTYEAKGESVIESEITLHWWSQSPGVSFTDDTTGVFTFEGETYDPAAFIGVYAQVAEELPGTRADIQGANTEVTVTRPLVTVESITLSTNNLLIPVGTDEGPAKRFLNVTFNPEDASDQTWTWSPTGTAGAFNANGRATTVGSFPYKVRANDDTNGASADLTITVYQPVEELEFTNSPLMVPVGTTAAELDQLIRNNVVPSPALTYGEIVYDWKASENEGQPNSPLTNDRVSTPGYYSVYVSVVGEPNQLNPAVGEMSIRVFQPVTRIAAQDVEVYVNYNLTDVIDELQNGKVIIAPQNVDRQLADWSVRYADTQANPMNEKNTFVKAGTYTFEIFTTSELYPEVKSTFQVKVIQRVEKVVYKEDVESFEDQDGNTWANFTFELGDNVKEQLLSSATVYPADATPADLDIMPLTAQYFPADDSPLDENGIAVEEGNYYFGIYSPTYGEVAPIYASVTILGTVMVELDFGGILSKYNEVEATLVCPEEGRTFDPSKVEIIFDDPDLGFPAAAVVKQDGTNVTLRGNKAGWASYNTFYDGEWSSGGEVFVQPELKLEDGWQWISLYAVPNMDGIDLYDFPMTQDSKNKILDLRSQTQLLYNDEQWGLLGDLEYLSVIDGMYKVKVLKDDPDFGLFSLANEDNFYYARDLEMNPVQNEGYNWISYPHEFSRKFENVCGGLPYQEGDMLIGKDGFAQCDGEEWIASDGFVLEANHGYMYYTKNPQFELLDFGEDYGLDEDELALNNIATNVPAPSYAPKRARQEKSVFTCDASLYADNMAIVAQIEGAVNTDNLTIGAFVGDECRGQGRFVKGDKLMINVAGKAGEQVSFKIYDSFNDEYIDIPETLTYSQVAGSLKEPVKMTASQVTAIRGINTEANHAVYDLSGRKVESAKKGLYIRDGKTVIVK